jgi:uvrB/uvrC protein
MLCDDCGKNQATYHEIRKINGRTAQVHLCEQCRRKHGYDVLPLSGMGDILGSFNEFFGAPGIEDATCEYCGTNINDFLGTGYLGCEHCYDRFSRSILPQLRQMQRKVQHVGKIPGKKSSEPVSEYARLKAELDKAVEAEDYEKAGRINEQLKKLKENRQ